MNFLLKRYQERSNKVGSLSPSICMFGYFVLVYFVCFSRVFFWFWPEMCLVNFYLVTKKMKPINKNTEKLTFSDNSFTTNKIP